MGQRHSVASLLNALFGRFGLHRDIDEKSRIDDLNEISRESMGSRNSGRVNRGNDRRRNKERN